MKRLVCFNLALEKVFQYTAPLNMVPDNIRKDIAATFGFDVQAGESYDHNVVQFRSNTFLRLPCPSAVCHTAETYELVNFTLSPKAYGYALIYNLPAVKPL